MRLARSCLMFVFQGEYCRLLWSEPIRKTLCRPLRFSKYLAYFDSHEVVNDDTSAVIYDSFLDEMEFLLHGGEICQRLDVTTNLVIIK